MVEPRSSNFRVITINFLGVRIFRKFTVVLISGEYCKMGDKEGKQVLMCSWGKKIEPDLEFAARTDKVSNEEEQSKVVIVYCNALKEKWVTLLQNQQNDLCAQQRLRSTWASAQSDQHLHSPHEEILGPQLPIEHTAKTRISLGVCQSWSESSLGTHAILLVLSWGGSSQCSPFSQKTILLERQMKYLTIKVGYQA